MLIATLSTRWPREDVVARPADAGVPRARVLASGRRRSWPSKQELKALARLAGTAEIKRTFPER
jgi:hypothetical protein